jgi:hypothetical protein
MSVGKQLLLSFLPSTQDLQTWRRPAFGSRLVTATCHVHYYAAKQDPIDWFHLKTRVSW